MTLKSRIGFLLDCFCVITRISLFKPRIVYIGDSHVHFLSPGKNKLKRFFVTHDNKLIIWLGPKLLYSVSKNGFRLSKIDRVVLRIASNKQPIVIVLGEIDCRVHFVTKTLIFGAKEFDYIAVNYKKNVMALLDTYKLPKALIISPIPSSDLGVINKRFPRNGLLCERVLVTKMITGSLIRISSSRFIVIDVSPLISNQDGSLDKKYTNDGVHLNTFGMEKLMQNFDFENM